RRRRCASRCAQLDERTPRQRAHASRGVVTTHRGATIAAVPLLLAIVLLAERPLAPANQMSGDVQASGCHGHLLVAWHDAAGVQAVVDGRAINVSASTRGAPAVACGADSWLVTWPSQDFGVDGRRVAFDGTLLAPITIFRGPFGASEVAAA